MLIDTLALQLVELDLAWRGHRVHTPYRCVLIFYLAEDQT